MPLPAHSQLEVFVKVVGLGAGSAKYHALLCYRDRDREGGQGIQQPKVVATGSFTHLFTAAAAPGLGMPEELRDVLMSLVDGAQTDDEDEERERKDKLAYARWHWKPSGNMDRLR